MRMAVRVLSTVLTALLSTVAVLGFGISQSLSEQGSADFAAAMQTSIQDPLVQQEIQTELRTGITTAGEQLASRAGPLAGLAGSGAAALADQAVDLVPTPRFQQAWQAWVAVLSTGLAATAEGATDPSVQVNGSEIVIAIEPLLAPLTGDSLAGSVTGLLSSLDRDTTITATTGIDLERLLVVGGQLARWDWLLAVGALVLAVVTVLMGANRLRWLGVVLLASAAGCAAGGALLTTASARPSEQMPELSRDVMTALTEPWVATALRGAAVLAVAGLLALAVAIVVGTRRGGEPRTA